MFEQARTTGIPETWYAVPEGWEPGPGFDRVIEGRDAALEMFRQVHAFLPELPPHDGAAPVLVVHCHPDLDQHPKYKHALRAAQDRVLADGEAAGVVVELYMSGRPREVAS